IQIRLVVLGAQPLGLRRRNQLHDLVVVVQVQPNPLAVPTTHLPLLDRELLLARVLLVVDDPRVEGRVEEHVDLAVRGDRTFRSTVTGGRVVVDRLFLLLFRRRQGVADGESRLVTLLLTRPRRETIVRAGSTTGLGTTIVRTTGLGTAVVAGLLLPLIRVRGLGGVGSGLLLERSEVGFDLQLLLELLSVPHEQVGVTVDRRLLVDLGSFDVHLVVMPHVLVKNPRDIVHLFFNEIERLSHFTRFEGPATFLTGITSRRSSSAVVDEVGEILLRDLLGGGVS